MPDTDLLRPQLTVKYEWLKKVWVTEQLDGEIMSLDPPSMHPRTEVLHLKSA